MKSQFRVRRLAVIDLHGFTGTRLRLWLVRIEFVLAVVVAGGIGGLFFRAGSIQGLIAGLIATGIAANYLVLTIWAVLLRRGRLEHEFRAYDVRADGQFYTVGQLRLVVPFLFPILALRPAERRI